MTIVFEDGDVKNVPFDLVVLPEEAEKAKEYAAAVVQVSAPDGGGLASPGFFLLLTNLTN